MSKLSLFAEELYELVPEIVGSQGPGLPREIRSIAIDSRKIVHPEYALFVALKEENGGRQTSEVLYDTTRRIFSSVEGNLSHLLQTREIR